MLNADFLAAKLQKTPRDPMADALPETLVRIPTEHAPTLTAQTEAVEAGESET
jgi:hypothetical protein